MRQTPPLPTSMPLLQQHLLQNKTLRKHTHTGTKEKHPTLQTLNHQILQKEKKEKSIVYLKKKLFKYFQKQNPHWIFKNHLNQNFSTSLLKLFQNFFFLIQKTIC